VAILEHNGSKTGGWISLYIGAAAVVSVIALICGRETRGRDLQDDAAVEPELTPAVPQG